MSCDKVFEIIAGALGSKDFGLEPLRQGGNNRLFLVTGQGRDLAAKFYYQHGKDGKDRQNAEWQFLTHVASLGVNTTPVPVHVDFENNLTLMTVVEGKRRAVAPSSNGVIQSATFIHEINKAGNAKCDLPLAAESGFSYHDHSSILGTRIGNLQNSPQIPELQVMLKELKGALESWRERVGRSGQAFSRKLEEEGRIISPSDFGFHNILIDESGVCRFIDFEYAGWDDPAKLACDFFWQPAVPVDWTYREVFLDTAFGNRSDYSNIVARVNMLRPLFGLRWCCIILNPFLHGWERRASFADPEVSLGELRRDRLEKASSYLERVLELLRVL